MPNDALVTQAVETGVGDTISTAENLLNSVETSNNTEISSLNFLGKNHISQNFEAHKVTILNKVYTTSLKAALAGSMPPPISGSIVSAFPTNIGILYVPTSKSPAGVTAS